MGSNCLNLKMKAGINKVQLQIRCSGVTNTNELMDYVRRRIRFALGRLDGAVSRVSVRLFDVNGPRGGNDKVCKIVMQTSTGSSLVIEENDSDLFTAVSRAAERAGRLAGTQLALGRTQRRIPVFHQPLTGQAW
jgi:putative sigma-54 modulation protein